METIIHVLRLIFQTAPLFIILYALQTHTKFKSIKMLSFFAIIVATNIILEAFQLQIFSFIFMTILTIGLNSLFFKKDLINSSIDYSVFLILLFPTGLILELLYPFFEQIGKSLHSTTDDIPMGLYMIVATTIALLVSKFLPLKSVIEKYRSILRKLFLIILNIFIFYFISREDFLVNSSRNVTIIILSFASIIVTNIFLFKEFWSSINRERMIRQHNEFIKNMDSVISDIKSKQHDFRNHLTTIKVLSYSDKNKYEDLTKSYIDSLNADISSIDYLSSFENKVIGAILYSKSCACKANGIDFKFECDFQDIRFPIEDFELTTVFTNLIDNAIEAVNKKTTPSKEILVKIGQAQNELYFQVSNNGDPIPFELIQKVFKKGFTTKENKKGHGYGLYNVNKTIQKYKGNIHVLNESPYVTFKVSFSSVA
jgi:two-component system, LytTR family, sensor histidine kinase AgrC